LLKFLILEEELISKAITFGFDGKTQFDEVKLQTSHIYNKTIYTAISGAFVYWSKELI